MADTCKALDAFVDTQRIAFVRPPAAPTGARAEAQTLRVRYMDHLYQQSGRTCGTYSGLWQQHKAALLDEFAQHLAEEARVLWGLDK